MYSTMKRPINLALSVILTACSLNLSAPMIALAAKNDTPVGVSYPDKGTQVVGQPQTVVGSGGELHQVSGNGCPAMTTQQGVPISDDQNILKVGPRGPALLEDFVAREKIFHFDHERIPERVVHARGYGAHGYFETYKPLSDITSADIFQRAGEKTPVFVRFSTVAGNKGSAEPRS